jgi:excisionase family DNA binding protein
MAKSATTAGDIMTVSTLAAYLQCHQSTVYRLLKEGRLPAFKLGSDWRFRRSEIERWIAGQHGAAHPATKGRRSRQS